MRTPLQRLYGAIEAVSVSDRTVSEKRDALRSKCESLAAELTRQELDELVFGLAAMLADRTAS